MKEVRIAEITGNYECSKQDKLELYKKMRNKFEGYRIGFEDFITIDYLREHQIIAVYDFENEFDNAIKNRNEGKEMGWEKAFAEYETKKENKMNVTIGSNGIMECDLVNHAHKRCLDSKSDTNFWVKNFLMALKDEVRELEEEVLWKFWSKDELLLFFVVSLAQASGMTSEQLTGLYFKKSSRQLRTQLTGLYFKKSSRQLRTAVKRLLKKNKG